MKNFRPVALLSPISKLVEKEIQLQVNVFMKENKLWNNDMNGKPDRLVRRIKILEESEARIQLTVRVWSITAERFYRRVENLCNGVTRISLIKKILCEWVKSNIPLYEE